MIWPHKPTTPEREAADAMAALRKVQFIPWGANEPTRRPPPESPYLRGVIRLSGV